MNHLDKKYNILRPIKNDKLLRLGRKADGGYVVDKKALKDCNTLITFGLGDDWSFENDLLKKNNNIQIHIYDHTVSFWFYLDTLIKYLRRFLTLRATYISVEKSFKNLFNFLRFLNLKNIFFYKEKVTSPIKKKKEVDLDEAFSRLKIKNNIILKIDIEGDEYILIDQIIKNYEKINILIFEFHWLDKNEKIFLDSVNSLKRYFDIIHIHGNNHCEKNLYGLPIALEITMNNIKYRPKKIDFKNNFPIDQLDYPNNPYKEDLNLNFKD